MLWKILSIFWNILLKIWTLVWAVFVDLLLYIWWLLWKFIAKLVIWTENLVNVFLNIDWWKAWSWMWEWFWKVLWNILKKAKDIWKSIFNYFKDLFSWKDYNLIWDAEIWPVSNAYKKRIEENMNLDFDPLGFSNTKKVWNWILNDMESFNAWVVEKQVELLQKSWLMKKKI